MIPATEEMNRGRRAGFKKVNIYSKEDLPSKKAYQFKKKGDEPRYG